MMLLLIALILTAIAFGIGAVIHFLWLGLIVLAIVAVVSWVARAA